MHEDLPQRIPGTNLFHRYVSYNEYGGIDKLVDREVLELYLYEFEKDGTLALGCWELQRGRDRAHTINVRLSPKCELDGVDNNWRSWKYTFVPHGV